MTEILTWLILGLTIPVALALLLRLFFTWLDSRHKGTPREWGLEFGTYCRQCRWWDPGAVKGWGVCLLEKSDNPTARGRFLTHAEGTCAEGEKR
jgi:hypothetical protein